MSDAPTSALQRRVFEIQAELGSCMKLITVELESQAQFVRDVKNGTDRYIALEQHLVRVAEGNAKAEAEIDAKVRELFGFTK
jgi:septal ring factor EnvC (AmiA/AmiB activator)